DIDIIINNKEKVSVSKNSAKDFFKVEIKPSSLDGFVDINFTIPKGEPAEVKVLNHKNEEVFYEKIEKQGNYSRTVPVLKKKAEYTLIIRQGKTEEEKRFSLNY
ncbi:MAG: hypothetical protein D6707_06265, partial [Bacteroidetes bacterium]